PNHRIRRESHTARNASSEYASACWPSSTPLPASESSPSVQATPRPTRRGWRTHQKASTSATKSGTRRRSRQGRKLRNSATANEPMMVLMRTGRRIWELLGIIALLFRCLVLDAGAARLVAAALLAGLRFVRARRTHHLARQHEHVAAALDARGRLAHHAGEAVLDVALDARHARHREAGRIDAVDARGDELVADTHFGIRRHVAQLERTGVAAAEG